MHVWSSAATRLCPGVGAARRRAVVSVVALVVAALHRLWLCCAGGTASVSPHASVACARAPMGLLACRQRAHVCARKCCGACRGVHDYALSSARMRVKRGDGRRRTCIRHAVARRRWRAIVLPGRTSHTLPSRTRLPPGGAHGAEVAKQDRHDPRCCHNPAAIRSQTTFMRCLPQTALVDRWGVVSHTLTGGATHNATCIS